MYNNIKNIKIIIILSDTDKPIIILVLWQITNKTDDVDNNNLNLDI